MLFVDWDGLNLVLTKISVFSVKFHIQCNVKSDSLGEHGPRAPPTQNTPLMNSMKLVILLHSLYWSIHTIDESKRGTAFAFIFGAN